MVNLLSQLRRYIRAFVVALKLTAQGNPIQPAARRYPHLHTWIERGLALTDSTFQIVEQSGLDKAAREEITLHLDKRDLSMETILTMVQHNLRMEYPLLMEAAIEHNITALYALNMNDQYRIMKLANQAGLNSDVQAAIKALSVHLNNIPPADNAD